MSDIKLEIEFPEKKVEVLKFFLNEKETTIENELQGTLDNLYDKHVPRQMKAFIEHQISIEVAEEPEQVIEVDTQPEETTRRRGRPRRNHQSDQEGQEEQSNENEQSEEGGMVLS